MMKHINVSFERNFRAREHQGGRADDSESSTRAGCTLVPLINPFTSTPASLQFLVYVRPIDPAPMTAALTIVMACERDESELEDIG